MRACCASAEAVRLPKRGACVPFGAGCRKVRRGAADRWTPDTFVRKPATHRQDGISRRHLGHTRAGGAGAPMSHGGRVPRRRGREYAQTAAATRGCAGGCAPALVDTEGVSDRLAKRENLRDSARFGVFDGFFRDAGRRGAGPCQGSCERPGFRARSPRMGNGSSRHAHSPWRSSGTRDARFACERVVTAPADSHAIHVCGMRLASFSSRDGHHVRVGRVSEEKAG